MCERSMKENNKATQRIERKVKEEIQKEEKVNNRDKRKELQKRKEREIHEKRPTERKKREISNTKRHWEVIKHGSNVNP